MNFLVSAGPTREFLDPVRFLTNRSTGKMGYAIAEAARDRGAEVVLVSGPVNLDAPVGVERVSVESSAQLCDAVLGVSRPGKLPHPTLVFQALRIAVNDELGQLAKALAKATGLLKKHGRIAVITVHSLEDRIVKNYFRDESRDCICPPGLPVCTCGHRASLKLVNRKPLTPGEPELAANRRAACARIRAAEKI